MSIIDLNSGNYGILYKENKKFVKIIDFRAPNTSIPLIETTLRKFLKANGGLYHDTDLAKKYYCLIET